MIITLELSRHKYHHNYIIIFFIHHFKKIFKIIYITAIILVFCEIIVNLDIIIN